MDIRIVLGESNIDYRKYMNTLAVVFHSKQWFFPKWTHSDYAVKCKYSFVPSELTKTAIKSSSIFLVIIDLCISLYNQQWLKYKHCSMTPHLLWLGLHSQTSLSAGQSSTKGPSRAPKYKKYSASLSSAHCRDTPMASVAWQGALRLWTKWYQARMTVKSKYGT